MSGVSGYVERPVCWIVVLGDFGRSPRMQYHAASLSRTAGYEVHVVAYRGASCVAAVAEDSHVHVHAVSEPGSLVSALPRALALILKAAYQALALLWTMLFRLPAARVVMMQCPPAVPTIIICLIVCWIRGSELIIDWHNFGFSLLALSLRKGHPLVRISQWYEATFGKMACKHLCVTQAMSDFLRSSWSISATVLHDCPPDAFKEGTVHEAHYVLMKMRPLIDRPMHLKDCCASEYVSQQGHGTEEMSVCTRKTGKTVTWRQNRPAIVVSSTSWTPDEDFSILLSAAEEYNRRCSASAGLPSVHPRLLIIVTGRGPQKEHYARKMACMALEWVAFRTAWLEPEDYPVLLGSADLGVSLHTSSSGLDLPMKVVDMFGCNLPVCSANYACIEELVTPDVNGRLFNSSSELADHFMDLFQGFCDDKALKLQALRDNLRGSTRTRWDGNWERHALPMFQRASS